MIIVGHRGARGLAPENTIASIQKAMEHQVNMLEVDLRITKDNHVVLHHDKNLIDPNNSRRRIASYTLAELREHKPDLATFEELLDCVNRKIPLYIEVKPKEKVQPIIATIKNYLKKGWSKDDIILASKSYATLKALHAALPTLPIIVISWSGLWASYHALRLDTTMISLNKYFLSPTYIRIKQRHGFKLFAYTVNSPKTARRLERAGLYAIVTDYPDTIQPLL
jgi:glycerophosphoryl diester phosphodiesterase